MRDERPDQWVRRNPGSSILIGAVFVGFVGVCVLVANAWFGWWLK